MNVVLFVIQIALLAVLLFGDIGFDHPGRFGLSFNHLIVFSFGYMIALISGIAFSIHKKKWKGVALQVLLPSALLMYSLRPAPSYHVRDYQHLVGKPKSYVEETLSSRTRITWISRTENGSTEFAEYRGMTVCYGVDGTVKEVIANKR